MTLFKRMAIIGAGQMGGGIAQIAATNSNASVTLFDIKSEQLKKQMTLIGMLFIKERYSVQF